MGSGVYMLYSCSIGAMAFGRGARRLAVFIAVGIAVCHLAAPQAFIPGGPAQRPSAPHNVGTAAAVAAGTALASMESDPALAIFRIPGGKYEKTKSYVMLYPDEDGFSDGQIWFGMVIALVCGVFTLFVVQALYYGLTPVPKSGRKVGYVTPLHRRFLELGFR